MRTWLLLFCVLLAGPLLATTAPLPAPAHPAPALKIRDVERLTGKKLPLLQKIRLFIAHKGWRKQADRTEMTGRQKRWAQTSLILGIASIVLLFIPAVGILCLPAAILAVVFGAKSLKGNSNTKGIIGVVTGGLVLLLFILVLLLIAAFFGF